MNAPDLMRQGGTGKHRVAACRRLMLRSSSTPVAVPPYIEDKHAVIAEQMVPHICVQTQPCMYWW